MKTNFYRFMGIGVLFLFCLQGFSQDILRYGVTPNNPVVSSPLLYWDLLRATSTGWVWQYRTTTPLRWNNYEKVENIKNADGDFTNVKTMYWDATTQTWQNGYNNLYTYQKDANNNVLQVAWEQIMPNYSGAVQFDNTYSTQGLLEESIVSFRNSGGYVPTTHIYMKYDGSGNRVLDSGVNIPTATNNLMNFYEYDNDNHCVKNVYMTLAANNILDTNTITYYTYTVDGNLSSIFIEYKQNNGMRIEASLQTYTYTATGKIDEMSSYTRDTNAVLLDAEMFYKHYYNTQNKLASMVFKQPTPIGWGTEDSVVINYLPNGGYDTAHMYVGDNDMGWESSYSLRLLFDKSTTGITQVNNITTNLTAYPNPTTNTLFVELSATTEGKTDLVLTDLSGRVLKTKPVSFFAGQKTTTELPITDLATGIYMLHTGSNTIKVIKQ